MATVGSGSGAVAVADATALAVDFRLSTFLTSDILTDTMDSCELKFMVRATVFKSSWDLQFFLGAFKIANNCLTVKCITIE